MVLTGGFLVAGAVILWMVLNRRNRAVGVSRPDQRYARQTLEPAAPGVRWQLAGCAALATAGLDVGSVLHRRHSQESPLSSALQ